MVKYVHPNLDDCFDRAFGNGRQRKLDNKNMSISPFLSDIALKFSANLGLSLI